VYRVGLCAGAALVVAPVIPTPAHAQTSGPASYRVAEIASGAVVKVTRRVGLKGDYGIAVVTVPFDLPSGSKQGVGKWYLLRLKLALTVRGGSHRAPAQVSAATNGHAAIQMQVQPEASGHGIVIDMLDLLQGETRQASSSPLVHATESNYLQLTGVHGGPNTLSVRVDSFGRDSVVDSARILPGTGIYATAKAPSNVSVKIPRAVRIRSGQAVSFPVRLVDAGDDARNVNITVSVSGAQVQLEHTSYRVAAVTATRPRTIDIKLRARRPGRGTLKISALSSGNQAFGETTLILYPYRRSRLAVIIVCIAVFLPATVVLGWRRDRRTLSFISGALRARARKS
jgi:hypothetical protein